MNVPHFTLHRSALSLALALALSACSGSDADASGDRASTATPDSTAAPAQIAAAQQREAALVDEIAANLQACSYDGAPVKVGANSFGANLPSDCRDMVTQIMKFTGLPQNFKVMEAPVPNAAAVIRLDEDRIPQRVIAFNKDFMNIVRSATDDNAWAPVSIMAHEIGHHLSGHTITPGGSQPPTELEADKFSGFVLYKMGATLDDAQKAMATLVADGPDGPTHPGRGRRLSAIAEGWEQACEQQGGDACASGIGLAVNPAPSSPAPTPTAPAPVAPTTPSPAPIALPSEAAPVAAATGVDTVPAPGSTPSKFDRFIYDEYGILDATWRGKFEKQMFEHAQQFDVEIVTLLVKDLHGLSGDEYALAMLRQLRVGKLDVGNGAVLVVAPDQNQVGVAMGPGVALEMAYSDKRDSLTNWLKFGWPECQRKNACGTWSENFMLASDHVRRNTDSWEWTIRYQSLGELIAAVNADKDARRESDAGYDPKTDPSFRKIARLEGKLVARDVKPGYAGAFVNDISTKFHKAMHVQTADGYNLMLYVDPNTESLMPGGELIVGKRYRFVSRVKSLSWNKKDTQAFNLLSYDLVD